MIPRFGAPGVANAADVVAQRQARVRPTTPFREFRAPDVEQTIPQAFERQMSMSADRIAVKTRQTVLTYASLNRAANRVARAILARHRNREDRVGLLLDHGAPFVIASLGVLKAGRVQVSMESTFPRSRLRHILEHAQADVVITNSVHLRLAGEVGAPAVINLDDLDTGTEPPNPDVDIRPAAPAAIAYTSGSTGRPKGIVWTHRGVLHAVMRHTNTYHLCADDRMLALRASMRPPLYALLNGAAYYPAELRDEAPADLADWIASEGITVYRSAVSAFRVVARALSGGASYPRLRLILLFGEPVYLADVELYRRHTPPGCLLGASLGCLEFDDYACCFVDHEIQVPGGVVPGGDPMEGADIQLLGEDGRPVGGDEVGEIVIRSRYHAAGYWRSPDLTHARFLPDPDDPGCVLYRTGDLGRIGCDGRLIHAGRTDFQVKIRGYRVEISEVEAALRSIEGVKDAAVVGSEESPGDTRLAAYLVSAGPRPPEAGDLRRRLRETLPDYMLPDVFVWLDALPLTATGKVDRRALPAAAPLRQDPAAPLAASRTPVEERLAAVWSEALGRDTVGVNDDVWTLGADSLRATVVLSRVLEEFHIALSLRALFDAPTVARMAAEIVRRLDAGDTTRVPGSAAPPAAES